MWTAVHAEASSLLEVLDQPTVDQLTTSATKAAEQTEEQLAYLKVELPYLEPTFGSQ
jgi:hypothetical protein